MKKYTYTIKNNIITINVKRTKYYDAITITKEIPYQIDGDFVEPYANWLAKEIMKNEYKKWEKEQIINNW